MKLDRLSDKPILTPNKNVSWESDAVLNTAVANQDGIVHLFYRGVAHPDWDGMMSYGSYKSTIGHAVSSDGIHFEREDLPVIPRETRVDGFRILDPQDPRVTKIDGIHYMTYCDWDGSVCYICLASSSDLYTWRNHGIVIPYSQFGMNKNAGLFPEKIGGQYAMIHRPEPRSCMNEDRKQFNWDIWSRNPDHPGGMRLAFSDDLLNWTYEDRCIMLPRMDSWDCMKIGLAGPPIKTDKGWLVVYHGVDHGHVYRLGVALLDLEDPAIILKRQTEPILEPEMEWEISGDVPGVVFSCGGFLDGKELWIYYGGGDTVIGAAKGDVSEFLCGCN